MVTWTGPLTKSHRQRQQRTLHTHPPATPYTLHTTPPLPRALPTPHLPRPPPRPCPSSPGWLFPPERVRLSPSRGRRPESPGPTGEAGSRGAQRTRPPRGGARSRPSLGRRTPSSRTFRATLPLPGLEGAGPRREEGAGLRGYGGHHDDGGAGRVGLLASFLAGGEDGVCIRGAGGRGEEVRVASRSALGHLTEVAPSKRLREWEEGVPGPLGPASAFTSLPLGGSRFPLYCVKLFRDPFGFQA